LRAALKKGRLTVGIQGQDYGSSHEGSEITVGEIGTIHELGLGVPRRSFLADWMTEKEPEIHTTLVKIGEAIIKRKVSNLEQGLERFGVWAVGSIQTRIRNRIAPELAASTIAAKGSSVPLNDTGQLRSSITYKVVK
jgi:hypothetical protein